MIYPPPETNHRVEISIHLVTCVHMVHCFIFQLLAVSLAFKDLGLWHLGKLQLWYHHANVGHYLIRPSLLHYWAHNPPQAAMCMNKSWLSVNLLDTHINMAILQWYYWKTWLPWKEQICSWFTTVASLRLSFLMTLITLICHVFCGWHTVDTTFFLIIANNTQ